MMRTLRTNRARGQALAAIVAVWAIVEVAACHRANLTPVSSIADYGTKAIATVNQIAKLTASLPIADTQKAPVMIGANLLQQAGGKLADALDAYRLATAANKAASAAKVNGILDEMDKVLRALKIPGDSAFGQVVDLLAQLASFLSHIRFSLSLPTAWHSISLEGGLA